GDVGVAIAVVLAVAVVMGQQRWRIWPVAYAAGALGGAELVVFATKALVGRAGPGAEAARSGYPGYYPSGHTATAMVAAGIVTSLLVQVSGNVPRRRGAVRASLVVGSVVGVAAGVFAVLGGHHWLTDVVGAIPIGLVVLVLAGAIARTRVVALES